MDSVTLIKALTSRAWLMPAETLSHQLGLDVMSDTADVEVYDGTTRALSRSGVVQYARIAVRIAVDISAEAIWHMRFMQ